MVERVLAVGLERVRIEEGIALERDACERRVVQRALQHVHVASVAREQEHPLVPVHVRDRRARFAVRCPVRELERVAERLVLVPRPHRAGDVQLPRHHIVPDPLDRGPVERVRVERRDVDHPRVHVGGADSMADRLALLRHRQVILVVDAVELARGGTPPLIEEETRQLAVATLAGRVRQLHQASLDDLVARAGSSACRGRTSGRSGPRS